MSYRSLWGSRPSELVTGRSARELPLDRFVVAVLPYAMCEREGRLARDSPLVVLNSVFQSGRVDWGMSGGCEWEPFELDGREYAELVAELKQDGRYRVLADPPSWVRDEVGWAIWLAEVDDGVPSEEHRRLRARCEAAQEAQLASWDEAVRARDPMVVVRRHHALLSAARAIEDLKAGRPIGSSDREMDTAIDRIARRASDARMAARVAEKSQTPG